MAVIPAFKYQDKLKHYPHTEPRLYLAFDITHITESKIDLKIGCSGIDKNTPNSPYWRVFYLGKSTPCKYGILFLFKTKENTIESITKAENYFKGENGWIYNWSPLLKRYKQKASKIETDVYGNESFVFHRPFEDMFKEDFLKECKKLKLIREDIIFRNIQQAYSHFDNL